MTSVHNLIVGKLYIWSEGDCYCINEMDNNQAHFYLKPKGFNFFSNNDYELEGTLKD